MKTTVPVFFGFDERFVPYAATAIYSMIANTDKERHYDIHVLHTDLKKKTMRELNSMKSDNVTFFFDDVTEDIQHIVSKLPVRDYYSPSTYFRLVIADKFPQYDKAIYVDSDTAIIADIGKLFDINIGDNYVGAVPEEVMQMEDTGEYARKVLNIDPKKYFNAGLLVINSKQWRENNLLKQFIDLVGFYTFTVAQDQDYLNVLCKGRVKYLERGWNMECIHEWDNIPEKKRYIIHYAFAAKPWHDIETIYGMYFWSYASKTPYFMDIKKTFAEYTLEQLDREKNVATTVMAGCRSEIEKPDNYQLKYEAQLRRNQLQPDPNFGDDLDITPAVSKA